MIEKNRAHSYTKIESYNIVITQLDITFFNFFSAFFILDIVENQRPKR